MTFDNDALQGLANQLFGKKPKTLWTPTDTTETNSTDNDENNEH